LPDSLSLARLKSELPSRHHDGYSMAELIDVADRLGLGLEGIRWDKRDGALTQPSIAYVRGDGGGHFVAIRPVGETGACVQVIDPPYSPRIIDYSRLISSQQWTGNLLVVRRAWIIRHQWLVPLSLLTMIGIVWAIRRRPIVGRSGPRVRFDLER